MLCVFYGGYHVQSSLGRVREQAIKNSFLGKACASRGPTALVAWALLNLAVYQVGTASYGSDYLPIRIEDIALVEDPIPAITRVLDFLAVGNTSQLQAIAERVKGRHSAAFGGRRYSAEVRAQKLAELGNTSNGASIVAIALRHFGYRTDTWGIDDRGREPMSASPFTAAIQHAV